VFVTPTCPHCPPAVLVPAIVIGGVPRYDGAVPERVFFQRLLEYA
jgi:hypothetical protein